MQILPGVFVFYSLHREHKHIQISIPRTGRIGSFILNIILTICGFIPGVIHAILVTNNYYADRRHKELLEATRR